MLIRPRERVPVLVMYLRRFFRHYMSAQEAAQVANILIWVTVMLLGCIGFCAYLLYSVEKRSTIPATGVIMLVFAFLVACHVWGLGYTTYLLGMGWGSILLSFIRSRTDIFTMNDDDTY